MATLVNLPRQITVDFPDGETHQFKTFNEVASFAIYENEYWRLTLNHLKNRTLEYDEHFVEIKRLIERNINKATKFVGCVPGRGVRTASI